MTKMEFNTKHIAKLEGNNKAHNWQLVEGCNSKHIAKLMRETIRHIKWQLVEGLHPSFYKLQKE
jgi:hypothetical protein